MEFSKEQIEKAKNCNFYFTRSPNGVDSRFYFVDIETGAFGATTQSKAGGVRPACTIKPTKVTGSTNVYLDANGGSVKVKNPYIYLNHNIPEKSLQKVYMSYDEPLNLNTKAVERDGYLFEGWYLDESLETPLTNVSSAVPFGSTLYAKWSEVQSGLEAMKTSVTKNSLTKADDLTYVNLAIPSHYKQIDVSVQIEATTLTESLAAELVVYAMSGNNETELCRTTSVNPTAAARLAISFSVENLNVENCTSIKIGYKVSASGCTMDFDATNIVYKEGLANASTECAMITATAMKPIENVSVSNGSKKLIGWYDEDNSRYIDLDDNWTYTDSEMHLKAIWEEI